MGSDIVADPRLGLQALVAGGDARRPSTAAGEDGQESPLDRMLADQRARHADDRRRPGARGDGQSGASLAPDRLADLVVLSADLFDLPASHLLDAVVIATVVDGKVVYDRDTDTPAPPTTP